MSEALFKKLGEMIEQVAAILEQHGERITKLEQREDIRNRLYQNPSELIEENNNGQETSTKESQG